MNGDFEMGCDFPLWWACAKIGYSLDVHARKLVSHWLCMRENWLLMAVHARKTPSAFSKIFLTYSSVLFSRPCLTSFVPSLTSLYCTLSPVLYPLSHRLWSLSPVRCTLSHVICSLSPNLVFRPLTPISCPRVSFSVALFHCWLLWFPSSVPPTLVLSGLASRLIQ